MGVDEGMGVVITKNQIHKNPPPSTRGRIFYIISLLESEIFDRENSSISTESPYRRCHSLKSWTHILSLNGIFYPGLTEIIIIVAWFR